MVSSNGMMFTNSSMKLGYLVKRVKWEWKNTDTTRRI